MSEATDDVERLRLVLLAPSAEEEPIGVIPRLLDALFVPGRPSVEVPTIELLRGGLLIPLLDCSVSSRLLRKGRQFINDDEYPLAVVALVFFSAGAEGVVRPARKLEARPSVMVDVGGSGVGV